MKNYLLIPPLLALCSPAHAKEGPPPVIGLPFIPTNISGDGTAVIGPEFFNLVNDGGPGSFPLTASFWTMETGTVELFPPGPVFGMNANPLGISRDGRFVVGGYSTQGHGGMMDNTRMLPGYLTAPSGFWIDRQTENTAYLSGRSFVDVSDSGDSVVGYNYELPPENGPQGPQGFTVGTATVNGFGSPVATWWQGAAEGGLLGSGTVLGPIGGLDWQAQLNVNAMDGAGTRAVGSQSDNIINGGGDVNFVQTGTGSQSVYWNLVGNESPQAIAIPFLPSQLPSFESEATDISRNGTYIVGQQIDSFDGPLEIRPYLFTTGNGVTEIPVLGGYASGVSNTGRVVGYSNSAPRRVRAVTTGNDIDEPFGTFGAWVYDEQTGPRTINQWLTDSGVEVGDLFFQTADAISEDGTVIVGRFGQPDNYPQEVDDVEPPDDFEPMFRGPGYIARAGSGAINPAQFIPTLQAGSQPGPLSNNLLNMTLHGAHHVPLQMRGADRHAWITGDFARNDRYDSSSALAEVGGAVDLFDKQLVAGLGIGQSWVNQDLLLEGQAELDGQYVLGELSYRATGAPFIFTLTGAYGAWDADIDRHYLNAGLIDRSFGATDVTSSAVRIRADWLDAAEVLGFGISPKLEYTVTRTESDAYTELGGGFPAVFNSQSQTIHQLRYGLTAARPVLQDQGLVRLRAEGVHRFDDSDARTTGTVLGLGPFNLAGRSVQQDWFLFGVDFDYNVTETVTITSGVSTSTSGQDPVFGATLGVLMGF